MGWHEKGSRTGGHWSHTGRRPESEYGWGPFPQMVMGGEDGHKHDQLIGYSEVHNAQRYSSTTEQVVQQVTRGGGRGGGFGYDYGAPPGQDGYKPSDPQQLIAPWRPANFERQDMGGRESAAMPVHLMMANGGSPRKNAGPKRNSPPYNPSGAASYPKPANHGGKYHNSSGNEGSDNESYSEDDDDDDDDQSKYPDRHRSKASNYHEYDEHNPRDQKRINGRQVIPNVPVTTHYEGKPFYSTPPPMQTGRAPDHFHKKKGSTKTPFVAPHQPQPNGLQRKDKGRQGPITSSEARKLYGGVSVPTARLQENHTGTIDCREAAEKYNGVFVPGNQF